MSNILNFTPSQKFSQLAVEKIAAKWKTMELRKSKPNIPVPFKCYIYQTRLKWVFNLLRRLGKDGIADTLAAGFGKVVGEFVCDGFLYNCEMANADLAEIQSQVHRDKIREYSGGNQVFGWHISDLVIYDDPKPLNEFMKPYGTILKAFDSPYIQRPPQSWCYVEELK